MNADASAMSIARHADPMAFLAAAAPVLARDEAMASSYVAFANGLLRNPPGEVSLLMPRATLYPMKSMSNG